MRYRLMFVTGLAVGYVLGSRAGRERYEQLREQAHRVTENPAVRNAAESAAQNGRHMATRAYDSVNERFGHRLPDAMSEKIHARGNGRVPADDDWGTSNT